jgi:hypothetical protein
VHPIVAFAFGPGGPPGPLAVQSDG